MIGGGAFTVEVYVVDADLTSAGGVVSVGVSILVWLWVAGPSGVDVTILLMGALAVPGVSLTSTNHERQSAALLWIPDILSKVLLYVDHLLTLLIAFLPFRHICRGVCSLHMTMSV